MSRCADVIDKEEWQLQIFYVSIYVAHDQHRADVDETELLQGTAQLGVDFGYVLSAPRCSSQGMFCPFVDRGRGAQSQKGQACNDAASLRPSQYEFSTVGECCIQWHAIGAHPVDNKRGRIWQARVSPVPTSYIWLTKIGVIQSRQRCIWHANIRRSDRSSWD